MYGSLINKLSTGIASPAPQVGDGATEYCYSDRRVYTVIEVSTNGKKVTLQEDSTRSIGEEYSQQWEITRNPEGSTVVVTLRSDGRWKAMRTNFRVFRFGTRDYYYDYSF
jgi:hypothetical protein